MVIGSRHERSSTYPGGFERNCGHTSGAITVNNIVGHGFHAFPRIFGQQKRRKMEVVVYFFALKMTARSRPRVRENNKDLLNI